MLTFLFESFFTLLYCLLASSPLLLLTLSYSLNSPQWCLIFYLLPFCSSQHDWFTHYSLITSALVTIFFLYPASSQKVCIFFFVTYYCHLHGYVPPLCSIFLHARPVTITIVPSFGFISQGCWVIILFRCISFCFLHLFSLYYIYDSLLFVWLLFSSLFFFGPYI